MAGLLMESGGVADRLINFSKAILGWSKGGLGAVNIIASFIFGGISGSSVADTAAIGSIMVPKMLEDGYDRGYAAAITVISSTLAVVVPPSILMIIIGAVGEISVARLLIGGIVPGSLMAGAMLIQNYYISKRHNYGSHSEFSFRNLWHHTKYGAVALGAPFIIIGGILTGIITPTEAGGLAVYYTIFVGFFVLKNFTIQKLMFSIKETAKITAAVMFVVACSRLFTFIITFEGLPQIIADWIVSLTQNPLLILLIFNAFLLTVGMLVDVVVAIILLVPILFPVAETVGIDLIHFGVIFAVNLAIGLVTPPFGVCLFSVCNIAKIKLEELVKSSFPLYLSLIIVLILISVFPQLILALPNLVFK
jgi:tripartite ATP-independent transporter DctM subunit